MQRYVSPHLTHFVGRGKEPEKQYALLVAILRSGWLTHPPHNPAISGNLTVNSAALLSRNEMYAPEVVCFCDIPLRDVGIHVRKYGRFGLAFPRSFIVRVGGAPVRYIPLPSRIRVLSDRPPLQLVERIREHGPLAALDEVTMGDHFDKMLREYHELIGLAEKMVREKERLPGVQGDFKRFVNLERFLDFHVFSFVKFFDPDLPDDHRDNYYMEREWRVVGNVPFTVPDLAAVLVPRDYVERLRADFPDLHEKVRVIE